MPDSKPAVPPACPQLASEPWRRRNYNGIVMPPPIVIDSLDDPRVADYQHIADHQHMLDRGLFIAEGRLVVRRLLDLRHWSIDSILLTPAAADNLRDVLHLTDAPIYLVDQALMNAHCRLQHPSRLPGARAPASRSRPPLDRIAAGPLSRVLVLEGVNNPDNVGGLFRTAAAFGVELVVLGPVVRRPALSQGDPHLDGGDAGRAVRHRAAVARRHHRPARPTASRSSRSRRATTPLPLDDLPRHAKLALVVGAEGDGLTEPAMAASTCPRLHSDDAGRGLAERDDRRVDCDVPLLAGVATVEFVEDVLRFLTARMQIEAEWAVQEKTSFTWWASSLRQRVWVRRPREFQGVQLTTLHVETDLIADVPMDDSTWARLASVNRFASLSAYVADPAARHHQPALLGLAHRRQLSAGANHRAARHGAADGRRVRRSRGAGHGVRRPGRRVAASQAGHARARRTRWSASSRSTSSAATADSPFTPEELAQLVHVEPRPWIAGGQRRASHRRRPGVRRRPARAARAGCRNEAPVTRQRPADAIEAAGRTRRGGRAEAERERMPRARRAPARRLVRGR